MECPIDFVALNENKARLTAFFVLVLTVVYLLTGFWLIMAFLLVDFLLRSVNLGKYSGLGILSDAVIKQLDIKNKPVDRAPKRFAAMVGAVFTAAMLATVFLQLPITNLALGAVMVVFATLESFFAFCAGCYVYTIGKAIVK